MDIEEIQLYMHEISILRNSQKNIWVSWGGAF